MRRNPRAGLTLTEVLVAMFVMALGLMALATLFPLGALQIGQALKDDRTGQVSMLADGWMRVYWRDVAKDYVTNPSALPTDVALHALDDPNLLSRQTTNIPGVTINRYAANTYSLPLNLTLAPRATAGPPATGVGVRINSLDVSSDLTADPTGVTPGLPADGTIGADGIAANFRYASRGTPQPASVPPPSFPVLIDPLGSLARSALNRDWAGRDSVGAGGGVYGLPLANTPTLVPRRNTQVTTTLNLTYSAFALTDDLTYQPNGGSGQTTTDPSTGAATPQPLGRQGRYTWAAVVQRPDIGLGHKAGMKVLVFDGRPVGFAAPGDEVVLANDPPNGINFHSGVAGGSRSLVLNVPTRGADQAPLIRRGGWLAVTLMETQVTVGSLPANTPRPGVRRVSFHRITGLTADDDTTVKRFVNGPDVSVTPVAVDIDPPLPPDFSTLLPAPTPPYAPLPEAQVVLLAGLSEVFDRPDLDASN